MEICNRQTEKADICRRGQAHPIKDDDVGDVAEQSKETDGNYVARNEQIYIYIYI